MNSWLLCLDGKSMEEERNPVDGGKILGAQEPFRFRVCTLGLFAGLGKRSPPKWDLHVRGRI